MTHITSLLFLVALIIYDQYKISRTKKKAAPESQKRIAEFNKQMQRLNELSK